MGHGRGGKVHGKRGRRGCVPDIVDVGPVCAPSSGKRG